MEIHPAGAFCKDGEHARKYAQKNAEKARQKQLAAQKRESRKQAKALLTPQQQRERQLVQTQRKFNELVRLLDKDEPCISCGRFKCGFEWDAGHFISRGASSFLRFCFLNCFKQGSACNRGEERFRANAKTVRKRYEENLIEKYGLELVDWLKYHQHTIREWEIDELKQMRAMYSAEIKYIEEYGKPSRDWRRFPPLEAVA